MHARTLLLLGALLAWSAARAAAATAGDAPAAPDPDTQPKWEAGIFLGATRLPLYRGSEVYQNYLLPVPFFIYRGEWIQSDRDGVRGIFLRGARFETTVSISGHPPVDGDEGARAGMPELSPLLEAGPAFKWWPFGKGAHDSFYAQAAARATASVDVDDGFAVGYEGLRGELSLHARHGADDARWRVGGALSLYLGDRDYHGYFYDVPAASATAERPAYDADGGYGGCGLSLFVTRRLRARLNTGLYLRWDLLGGAAFADSPLVERDHALTAGAAVIWRFAESARRVPRRPE